MARSDRHMPMGSHLLCGEVMIVVQQIGFATERRGSGGGDSETLHPIELLQEWLNSLDKGTRVINIQQLETESNWGGHNLNRRTLYLVVRETR